MTAANTLNESRLSESDDFILAERRASDISRAPRASLNGLLIAAIGTLTLVLLSFMSVDLPNLFSGLYPYAPDIGHLHYNFQLPLALFLGAFLGSALGGGAVLAFMLAGLFFMPVFSGGGGLDYVTQPGFGYLVGMLVSAWVTGRMMRRLMSAPPPKRTAMLVGVACASVGLAHLLGVAGLGILWACGRFDTAAVQNWLLHLSVEPLPYDIITTVLWIGLVRYARLLGWLVLY